MKEKNSSKRFFLISMALLAFFTVMIWGFQTDWGYVTIDRINIIGDDGGEISSLVYSPKNATNETPAPAVFIYHGRSNQGHSNDTWCMELANRGYVVFSPDLFGGGESDPGNRNVQAIALAKYATTLNYIDTEHFIYVGYSAGCMTASTVADTLPENSSIVVAALAPNLSNPLKEAAVDLCVVKAVADQYNWEFIGDVQACADAITERFSLPEEVVSGKDYRMENGKNLRYVIVDDTLHQTGNISRGVVTSIVDFVQDYSKAPRFKEAGKQTWVWQQLFSGAACVTMMFVLASLIGLLLENPYFATITNERPVKEPQTGTKAWLLDVLFSVVIPFILFIPVSALAMAYLGKSKLLRTNNLNGIMFWLIALAIIGVVRMALKIRKGKQEGKTYDLSSFALGAEGENKIDWSKPLKSLLIALIVVVFTFSWLAAIEDTLGINYQVWNLSTYLEMFPRRFFIAIPYIIIIFVCMFIGNLNQRTLPSTGDEKKDMRRAVIVNTVLTAGALFLLLLIQYGGNMIIGTGQAVFEQIQMPTGGTSVGALDFAFGYCYMMGGTTAVVTYIYRKYGNIWAGVIPCACFAGLVTTMAFTLVS